MEPDFVTYPTLEKSAMSTRCKLPEEVKDIEKKLVSMIDTVRDRLLALKGDFQAVKIHYEEGDVSLDTYIVRIKNIEKSIDELKPLLDSWKNILSNRPSD